MKRIPFLLLTSSIMLLTSSCVPFDFTDASVQKIADLQGVQKQSYQGMAIYGDYLVSLQNTGQATIYRFQNDKLQPVRQFPLASHTAENHANVAFFGTERYHKSDQFPLLYVSQCSKQLYRGMKDVCFVERISLTGDPVVEVKVANEILKSLGLKEYGPTLVACPTCGRTSIDLPAIAAQVEKKLDGIKDPIDVAVMGCVVNGPGEARGADVGIAGGNGEGLIFRKGEIIRKVPENILVDELFKEIDAILEERRQK